MLGFSGLSLASIPFVAAKCGWNQRRK
nr:variable surface lipoprotein [Mycoplasmopsis bovis]